MFVSSLVQNIMYLSKKGRYSNDLFRDLIQLQYFTNLLYDIFIFYQNKHVFLNIVTDFQNK